MMRKRLSTLNEILKVIRKAKSVLLTGHIRTDGDSLGCMIALGHQLNRAGIKTVTAGMTHGLGAPGFLEGVSDLVDPEIAAKGKYDLVIVVDCAALDRVPDPIQKLMERVPSVCIDHHVSNTRFATSNWVRVAAATGEMVWQLIRRAGWTFDRQSAEALWVALITDSGRFAYDSTTPSTLRCGSDLLKHGVRTNFINDKIYASFSAINIELKRRAFRTLTIEKDIAYVSLTGRDFEETGGTKSDAEDVIDIPRNIAGNLIALFFYGDETDNAETRVSIRTRDPYSAVSLAQRFGGGGHDRAAGCTLKEPLSRARHTILAAIEEWRKGNQ